MSVPYRPNSPSVQGVRCPVFTGHRTPWLTGDDHLEGGDEQGRRGALGGWGRPAYAHERITIDPNRMSGPPCIRDTRVTVSAVLGQLAAGLTIPELLADFPYLDRADVLAALEFAAAAVQERELQLAHSA
jgi:uncharacterized protein (DUF433 family)